MMGPARLLPASPPPSTKSPPAPEAVAEASASPAVKPRMVILSDSVTAPRFVGSEGLAVRNAEREETREAAAAVPERVATEPWASVRVIAAPWEREDAAWASTEEREATEAADEAAAMAEGPDVCVET